MEIPTKITTLNNLISVIVPCYNQAHYLPEALDSILAQSYDNWECIIVNDGSPDNSEEVALQFCARDERFKYLKKVNGGLSSARNAGLRIAKGEWIQFLDSDDYIAPNKFELSIELIKQDPAISLVVSNFRMFINHHTDATSNFCEISQQRLNFDDVLFGWDNYMNIPIHSGLFKSSLFHENPFVESLKAKEDWIMWLSVFRKDIGAIYLDLQLAYYRDNPKSMTKNRVFERTSQITAYQYIVDSLPEAYVRKFSHHILERLRAEIINYENDVRVLRAKVLHRIEKKVMGFLRRHLSNKKKT